MSSIYRKGRDGYYYYQTYTLNPKSGKKNKRIFHSLGTKNFEEAKKKQIAYDINYEKKGKNYFSLNFKSKWIIILYVVFIIIFFSFFNQSATSINQNNPIVKNPPLNPSVDIVYQFKNKKVTKNINENEILNDQVKLAVDNSFDPSMNKNQQFEENIFIPKNTVQRFEKISNAFDQVKLFVTIENSASVKAQKDLCKKLKKDYNNYDNLIICLYKDSEVGVAIAKGNEHKFTNKDIKEAWFAMYTYNPVEGEYFDENPAQYLQSY